MADVDTGRPMRPTLAFRAGSTTKSFTATVVLQLVAEHRLRLGDTVERWLPGVLPYGGRVTIRALLQHTSGVPAFGTADGRRMVVMQHNLLYLDWDRWFDAVVPTYFSFWCD